MQHSPGRRNGYPRVRWNGRRANVPRFWLVRCLAADSSNVTWAGATRSVLAPVPMACCWLPFTAFLLTLYLCAAAYHAPSTHAAPPCLPFPQLIHGDLHYDNVMVVGDQVGAWDVGLCEAIVLTHIA